MGKSVEFYFDFGSPTAYLAHTQLPAIAEQTGSKLIYKPILLGGIFQATKNSSPITIPSKGSYMMRDLARFARRYQVPLQINPHFPINTLMLMRMAIGVRDRIPERFEDLVSTIFNAIWIDGSNMGDVAVVKSRLEGAALDAGSLLELAQDESVKLKLKQETAEAVSRGLFGAPTMFVGKEMFWGQDRLDFVREALET